MPHKDPEARKAYARAYQKRWREKHPERRKKHERDCYYKRRTPEYLEAAALRARAWRLGVTPLELREILKRADGRCAACGEKTSEPHVDHCHATGKIRGVLCRGCNLALGHAKNDPAVLRKLAEYLE